MTSREGGVALDLDLDIDKQLQFQSLMQAGAG